MQQIKAHSQLTPYLLFPQLRMSSKCLLYIYDYIMYSLVKCNSYTLWGAKPFYIKNQQ